MKAFRASNVGSMDNKVIAPRQVAESNARGNTASRTTTARTPVSKGLLNSSGGRSSDGLATSFAIEAWPCVRKMMNSLFDGNTRIP